MKVKYLRTGLVLLLIAAVIAVSFELVLDFFVNSHTEMVKYAPTQEEYNEATYRMYPEEGATYIDSKYEDGMLIPVGEDPYLSWTIPDDVQFGDLTVHFSESMEDDCIIKIYYDDTGNGYSEDKTMTARMSAGETDILFPIERNYYHALRVDIDDAAPLAWVECDASAAYSHKVQDTFHVARCLYLFAALALVLIIAFQYRTNDGFRGKVIVFREFLMSDFLWAFLVSIGISIYFTLYHSMSGISTLEDALNEALHPFWPIQAVTFVVAYAVMQASHARGFSIGDWLYQKRWILGFCVLALCIVFNLNFSSLHEWAGYLGNTSQSGVLLGVSRTIRSDEWAKAIGVLKAISFENYPTFSQLIRATSTENVLIAGQVAWDISALFRPFTWGVLLLGNPSYGLSSNQFGMAIVMFLLSFDFFMLVSKNRKLSLAFATVLFFSPFVQWWTSYNLFVSIFALLLTAYKYLTSETVRQKILYAICVIIFAGNYALVLYPAWQVPVAYVMLAGLIWIIISYRKQIKLRLKVDLPIIATSLLILVACGAFIYMRAAPAVHDMVSTVYPGTVRNSAPASVDKLFLNYLNMFSPYTEQYVPGPNLSEAADFISFFPAGILLCIYAMIRNRKADAFSIIMIVLSLFFSVFTFMNVSETLRIATFMSFSFSQRILPWLGFVQILLLFRGVSMLNGSVKWYIAIPASALFALYSIWRIKDYPQVAGRVFLLSGMGILLFVIIWFALRSGKSEKTLRAFSTIMVFFALFTAGTVHPIQRGMDEIEQSDIVMCIQEVVQADPSGKWLVEGLGYPYGMVPLMGGAPTINCVNNYPNLEMWYKLDPERKDEFAYNRYATQINTILVHEDTSIDVGYSADLVDLRLNPRDLEKMEVSYLMTNRNLSEFSTDDARLELVSTVSFVNIYHVDYDDSQGE